MSNLYETDRLVAEYLLFHYATPAEFIGVSPIPEEHLEFPVRTVQKLLPEAPGQFPRALDVGCAVGRSSFELSKVAQEVVGIDFSQAFIKTAQQIQRGETLAYRKLEEGHVTTELAASLPTGSHPERVSFEHGDAMALRDGLGTFDLVHAANLICRLPEPRRFLAQLPQLVRPGGYVLMTTPCTWLAEFTPPENWPTGSTFEWLQSELGTHFHLKQRVDLPFVIRETARKFQWTTALGTVWQRKET
jgi:putative 4-mercaptohistidine N1-methyltranferase